jgi:hypothetical protein
MIRLVCLFVVLGIAACGGAAAPGPAAETTPAPAPAEGDAAPAVDSTGTWTVGSQPFTPAAALAVRRDDGHYTVTVSSAVVDCTFARDGGVAPENLREVRVETSLEPGAALESRTDDATQQVVFVYEAPSEFTPGQMSLQNSIAQGTFTVLSHEGARARLRLEAQDPFEATRNAVSGEVEVVVCE